MTESSSLVPSRCLICSTPNSSIHFGVDACRACTSFFKRAKLSGQKFPCRRGDHNCPINREAGSLCRGCRYDKCTALGMIYDGPLRTNKECKGQKESDIHIDSIPSSSGVEESLLQLIAREHATCLERRRIRETELVYIGNLERVPHPTEEIYMADYESALASFNITVSESWTFFLTVFPSIKELPYQYQREFFRQCCPQFALIDCFDRTKKLWGGFQKYSMCSVLLCSDLEKPEMWVRPHEGGAMRKELLMMVRAYVNDQLTMMVPVFEQADMCETEKHALLALLLTESELESDMAERFQSFLDSVRNQTLQELHRFYTEEMGLTEYSIRLGKLFTICLAFREGNVLFREFFRMQVTIFDVYVAETLLQELLIIHSPQNTRLFSNM